MRVLIRAAPRVRPWEEGQTTPQFSLLPRRQPSFLVSLALSVVPHAAVLETTPGLLVRAEYWRFRPPEVEKLMARTQRATPLLVRVPDLRAQEKLFLPAQKRQRTPSGGPARPAPARPARDSVSLEAPVPAPPRLPSSMAPSAAMERARVYLPPSGSNPLSGRRQWLQEPELPSAANTGTPAAFIIITPERAKPGETITVPPGSLVVLGSGTGQAAEAAPAAAAGKPVATADAKPVSGSGGEVLAARLEGRPGATGARGNGAANGAGVAEAKPQDAAANPGAAGAPNGSASPAGAAGAKSAAMTRTIRTAAGDIFALVEGDGSVTLTYPAGGSFDVVVVDASLPQAISTHTSALSGSPVYTAYLNVGQPVEWILHYCLPGGEAGARRQYSVVTLSAPKPLKAPYVVEAHLPPELVWRWNGYQVFHALLSVGGRLERLQALQAGGAADELLDSLRRWIFRPALLVGAPTATEVLLVIPPFRP